MKLEVMAHICNYSIWGGLIQSEYGELKASLCYRVENITTKTGKRNGEGWAKWGGRIDKRIKCLNHYISNAFIYSSSQSQSHTKTDLYFNKTIF